MFRILGIQILESLHEIGGNFTVCVSKLENKSANNRDRQMKRPYGGNCLVEW